jgi:hypothetical protein
MAKQTNDKLDFSDITFDDFVGDGLDVKTDDIKDDKNNKDDLDDLDDTEDDDLGDDQDDNNDDSDDSSDDDSNDDSNDDDSDDSDSDQSDDDGEDSLFGNIAKAIGIELENEYEDSEEGLIEFTKDVAQNLAEEQLEALFAQFPLVQKHLDFVMAGGDPEKFFETYNPQADYSKVEIEEDDSRTQKAVLTEFFKTKGHDESFIKEMIEDYEDSGKLYAKATAAKTQLAKIQETERGQLVERQKQERQQQIQTQNKFWEGVAETIEKGKEFAGIRIPEKEKSKFFDYISQPVDKSGKTKRDDDYAKADLEVKLAIDYLMFKGFKLQDIIQTKARTTAAEGLRDKIKKSEANRLKGGSGKFDKTKKFDVDDLDMKTMFGK